MKRELLEIGNGDGTHFVSVKREYYGPESGRYSRGSKEDSYEFNRTLRKPFQKKSAFLRIQKPNNRNTEHEQFHNYGYHDNSNFSSYRRRDQYVYTGSGLDEEERAGSSVELDVSFKSNSLVAKAIVTPTSTFDVTDTDLTLKNVKGSNEFVSDKERSIADVTKVSGNTINVDGSAYAVNAACTSDKERMQSEEATDVKDICDASSQNCLILSVTNQSLEKHEVERPHDGANSEKADAGVHSTKPAHKAVKKKKVVKKIVKKVVRPRSRMLNTEQKKKSEDSGTDKGVTSLSYSRSDELNNLDTRGKLEGPEMTREEEHGMDLNSSAVDTQKNLSINQESSMQGDFKVDKGPEHAENSSKALHAISNGNEVLVDSCHVSSTPIIAHMVDSTQSQQSGSSLSVGNYLEKDSSLVMLPIAENMDSALLNANSIDTKLDALNNTKLSKEESLVQEEISKSTSISPIVGLSSLVETTMDVRSSHHDTHGATSLDYNNVSNYEEKITSSNASDDCIIKQLSVEAASELPEIAAIESSSKTKVPVGDNAGDTSTIRRKRTIRSQLGFSRDTNNNLNAINSSNAAIAVDTSNLSSGDPSYEVAVSSMQSLDDGLQPGSDWVNVPHNGSPSGISQANLIATDGVNFDVTPPQSSKRRKVSAFQLTSQTDEITADASTSCLESPLTSNEVLVQQQMEVVTSAENPLCAAADLMNCENGISVLHNNKLSEGNSDAVMSFFIDEQKKDVAQRGRDEKRSASVLEEQDIAQGETQCTISSGIQPPDRVETFLSTGMESDNLLMKDNFPNFSSYLSSPDDRSGATSIDEATDFVPDLANGISPQTLFNVSDLHMSDATSVSQISYEPCMQDNKLDQKSVEESGVHVSVQKYSKTHLMSDCTTASDQTIEGNTPLPLQDSRSTSQGLNMTSVGYNGQKNQHSYTTPRTFPGRSSFGLLCFKKTVTATNANARTWHRNASSSTSSLPGIKPFQRTALSQRQLPGRGVKFHSTSYVRKGNSLVRNPSPAVALSQGSGFSPVYRLNPAGLDESKKSSESENRVGVGNLPGILRVEETKASGCYKPRSSTTQSANKLPSCTAVTSDEFTSFPSAGPLSNLEPVSSAENNDTPKLVEDSPISEAFENQNGLQYNSDNQTELNDENLASLNMKRIVYVKRKSNQLVATSNSIDLPVANADKIQTSSFDGYYKRRKNQLIRTSLESTTGQPASTSDNNLNAGVQMPVNAFSNRRLIKRRSQKVVAKTFKRSAKSLVWTLCGTETTKNDCGSFNHQKVLPHLFPWKRTAYSRSFMHNWNLVSKSSSSTAIRKLLLSRKRDTVYTRSANGFSLRKSKVLSVGGSSLKWSKSIERHSKRANEEATLAVAAVERKKREQKGATCTSSGSKSKNHSSRERIFRIGSCRYKMDPSRRTLQRISDDESSCAPSTHQDKGAKRSYIPRRLMIGNNEYIRIGNGNQLIRDPKKRTRILASEKVRWSLHTARLRLARKKKYCQFFTRFGRCNKDSGRCPYLHDPSKIAVCTKYLNGSCSDANCKLTHKVIPERMPDCSFFLQGLCSNQSCPYRHVNVNPKASTCEGFLRGYCADGDECRKKHSYVCPTFEATGACPQGSKCKLHHPKNRIHGKKRKRSRELRNARGRYFGSPDVIVLESRTAVSEKCFAQDSTGVFLEGACADYIAIGVSDDDIGETNDSRNTQTTFYESDTSSDLELEDLNELIKPVRLMDTSLTT